MKKITLFLVLALFVGICYSQTVKPKLYVYAFADTDDETIGSGEEKNLANFSNLMGRIGAQLKDYIIMQDVVPYFGYECNKPTLEAWMKEVACGPNDVVMFAYMGHGTRSTKDVSTQFPQMCLGSTYDEDFVNLEWVKNQLEKKKPRLCIVLGDCCNSIGERTSVKPLQEKDSSVSTVSCGPNNAHIKALKKLFCETQGSIIASGSKPGELSWINTDPRNKMQAGCFMDAWIRAMDAVTLSSSVFALWDDVFKQVQQDPSLRAIRGGDGQIYMQHPIYKIDAKNLGGGGMPNPIIEDTPLTQALLSVGDDKIAAQQREKNIDIVLQHYFADGASVSLVSQQGRPLETMYAKDYLVELSKKVLFRGAVIRSVEKDSQGKITKLAIHEIFEKKIDYDKF